VRPAELATLLREVRRGGVSPARAARRIAEGPLETLEGAALDHQRALRTGFPEVVFGLGKTPAQLVAVVGRLYARHGVVLATRVDDAGRAALAREFPSAACSCCAPGPPTCRWRRRRWSPPGRSAAAPS
jgi:hypothetical protein